MKVGGINPPEGRRKLPDYMQLQFAVRLLSTAVLPVSVVTASVYGDVCVKLQSVDGRQHRASHDQLQRLSL